MARSFVSDPVAPLLPISACACRSHVYDAPAPMPKALVSGLCHLQGGIVKKEKGAKAKAGLHSSAPPHATTTATTSVQSTAPDTDDAPGSAGANLDLIETISASSARQPAGHVNLLGTSYSSSSDGEED